MKILLFGAYGQLGRTLQTDLKHIGQLICPKRYDVNLSDFKQLKEIVKRHQPKFIVNAAAYTNVEESESHVLETYRINALAPAIMAHVARELNAFLIHYSTDYVFDGKKATPYLETDIPSPCNIYGASKREGERLIAQSGCKHFILRLSWLFSPYGKNFLKSMLKMATTHERIRVVNDQFSGPTSTALVSKITACLIHHGKKSQGIYHVSGKGKTNWAMFASYIIKVATKQGLINSDKVASIEEITSASYPQKAKRPPQSQLNTEKIENEFGLELPHWKTLVSDVVGELQKNEIDTYTVT